MKKICVIGGPSSGKTTAALELGVRLKMMGYEVHFILEILKEAEEKEKNPKIFPLIE